MHFQLHGHQRGAGRGADRRPAHAHGAGYSPDISSALLLAARSLSDSSSTTRLLSGARSPGVAAPRLTGQTGASAAGATRRRSRGSGFTADSAGASLTRRASTGFSDDSHTMGLSSPPFRDTVAGNPSANRQRDQPPTDIADVTINRQSSGATQASVGSGGLSRALSSAQGAGGILDAPLTPVKGSMRTNSDVDAGHNVHAPDGIGSASSAARKRQTARGVLFDDGNTAVSVWTELNRNPLLASLGLESARQPLTGPLSRSAHVSPAGHAGGNGSTAGSGMDGDHSSGHPTHQLAGSQWTHRS